MNVSLGEQELAVLRFIAERAPISMGDAAEAFGAVHGLARSTVLTIIERLRRKDYLTREQEDGVYLYRPTVSQEEILYAMTRSFTERILGGRLLPFVAFLSEEAVLTDEELDTLERLVDARKRAREGVPQS